MSNVVDYVFNFLSSNNQIISFFDGLGKIITVGAVVCTVIAWIWRFFTREKIKIHSFGLKMENGENNQVYQIKNNQCLLKAESLNQDFYFPPMFRYDFPEFDVILKNNTENSYVMNNFGVRINKIEKSLKPFLFLEFVGDLVWFGDKITGEYRDLVFKIHNYSHFRISDIKIIDVKFFANIGIFNKDFFEYNNNFGIIESEKEDFIKFSLQKPLGNFSINKIFITIECEFNGEKIQYVIQNDCKGLLFHDEIVGFYAISGELGGGCIEGDYLGKFLLPIRDNFYKNNLLLSCPQKYFLSPKDVYNFEFSIGVDYPCILDVDVIFDFGDEKLEKNLLIDFSYPTCFDSQSYIEKGQKMNLL